MIKIKTYTIIPLFLLFISLSLNIAAQDLHNYLQKHAQFIDDNHQTIDFGSQNILNSDLIFFGFIHGAATPQKMDYKLLEYFIKEKQLRYYAPEVDFSQAYFLNQYLKSGNEAILDFVLYFYENRVPQDASLQFKEKWQKIYQLNQTLANDKKITILGTDSPLYDKRLAITHLAHLLGDKTTGNAMVDSLKLFKSFEIEKLTIWSGKPAFKMVQQYGGSTYNYVYPLTSKFNFADRFSKYYKANKSKVVAAFDIDQTILENILEPKAKKREFHIYESFKSQVIPLIQKGAMVYANFGFAHVLQDQINGRDYIAGLIKKNFPDLKVSSILGLLTESEVLTEKKLKKTGEKIIERGLEYKVAAYSGFKTSTDDDGHSSSEKLLGIDELIQFSENINIVLLDLGLANSPFTKTPYLLAFEKGGEDFKIKHGSNTLDYFQYVILMRNSLPNTPLEESNQ